MGRSFFDKNLNTDDMQMQIYGLLASYIDEAGLCILAKNPQGLCDMIQIIFPCVHTRIEPGQRETIKARMYEIRNRLAYEGIHNEELTSIMDELYELYLQLQEVLQKEGITLKVRTDPGSIVAR